MPNCTSGQTTRSLSADCSSSSFTWATIKTRPPQVTTASRQIVAMTGRHVLEVVETYPPTRDRTLTLPEWANAVGTLGPIPEWAPESVRAWAAAATDRPFDRLVSGDFDISDPVGRPRRQYRRVAERIRDLVTAGLAPD